LPVFINIPVILCFFPVLGSLQDGFIPNGPSGFFRTGQASYSDGAATHKNRGLSARGFKP
jgi:hypothetical protein